MSSLITERILIKFESLDSDILEHIKIQLNTKIGSCTKKHGYINRITDAKIISNKISTVCPSVIFTVEYKLDNFKPEKEEVYVATILTVIESGILLNCNTMEMFISSTETNLNGYQWNTENESMIKDGEELCVGDTINVELTNIRYERSVYTAAGKLVD
jgi:DNA-directed RNA polymerase subunit E'/Rpb7